MESPQYASCLATNPEKLQHKRGARRERGPVGNTHPSFWKQSSGPFPGPLFLPLLSSRPSIQGPGLIVFGDENRQSSASPARPVRALVLCVPQHLMCLHCAHSSYPHLNSKVSSLLSSPCSEHRNHSCPLFSDSPGLCHGPLSPAGDKALGDW